MRNSAQAYQRVDELINAGADEGFGPKPRHPRVPGGTKPVENPLGTWYVRCHVEGAPTGQLASKTPAVKDTIAVSGAPMMNGSRALEGFTPDFEATCVARALDAGATVVGKAVAEDLCYKLRHRPGAGTEPARVHARSGRLELGLWRAAGGRGCGPSAGHRPRGGWVV